MFISLADLIQDGTHWLLQWSCHQETARLVHIGDHALPLCPRCSGLQAGFLLGSIVVRYVFRRMPQARRSSSLLVLLAACTAVHWVLDAGGLLHSTPIARLVTGVLSGCGGGGLFALYLQRRGRPFLELPGVALIGLLLLVIAGIALLPLHGASAYVLLSGGTALMVGANLVSILGTFLLRVFPRLHRDTTHHSTEMRHDPLHS